MAYPLPSILMSDVRDVWEAHMRLADYHGYLEARGYDATRAEVLLALLKVQPWRRTWVSEKVSPWRKVAASIQVQRMR